MGISRGRFAVFGFSDVTCALLVVGAPIDKFHCYRQIKQFFNDYLPLLSLNLWEGSCCNRSRFELEPLDAHGIMQRDYESYGGAAETFAITAKATEFLAGNRFCDG